eukprot:jgi/Mesen1/2757/ME000017S02128
MGSTRVAQPVALALDIPTNRRLKTLRAPCVIPASVIPPLVDASLAGANDFSDVFGPVVSSQPVTPHPQQELPSTVVTISVEVEEKYLSTWAPLDSISSGNPPVLSSRSHSLVGPEVPPLLSQCRQQSKLCNLSDNNKSGLGVREVLLGQVGNSTLKCSETYASVASLFSEESTQNLQRLVYSEAGVVTEGCLSRVSSAENSLANHAENGATPVEKKKIGPDDFELLRVVGQGAFGKVFQVRKKDSGEILAMKVMRKDRIIERNHGDYMKAEKEILTKMVHPFIVQLQYSFQTRTKLYLLLEFVNGGHLFFQLYRQGTFSEELARIYTAELVSAVAHLHKNGIMHRDLKPENVLLDSEGHVKLTDFGLAKEVDELDRSNSLCGTVEYMAPEILQAKGHGRAADWWSVGILLFEMLTGQPPFAHNNRQKLQQKIIKDKIKFPSFLTAEAHNLLKGLLQKDPAKRLGSGANGSNDVQKHKWFRAINWRKVEGRELQAKFRPTVNGKICTANFDDMWTCMPVQDSPASTPTGSAASDLLFRGYTYVAPYVWLQDVHAEEQVAEDCGDAASEDDDAEDDAAVPPGLEDDGLYDFQLD